MLSFKLCEFSFKLDDVGVERGTTYSRHCTDFYKLISVLGNNDFRLTGDNHDIPTGNIMCAEELFIFVNVVMMCFWFCITGNNQSASAKCDRL